MSPADIPMHIAVSTLSPVIIQILIPAFLNWEIHSRMFYCNLSSTPVMPNNSMLLSSDAIDLLIIASLLIIEEFASSNYFFQA